LNRTSHDKGPNESQRGVQLFKSKLERLVLLGVLEGPNESQRGVQLCKSKLERLVLLGVLEESGCRNGLLEHLSFPKRAVVSDGL